MTHVGAREYDPSSGQFISVDPVLSLDQHQSLNGYSYAGNSPITNADPTGLQYPADQNGSGGANGSGCYFVLTNPCGGTTTKPAGQGGSGCYYVLSDPCGTTGGGGGTSHTSSSGQTSSGGQGAKKGPGDSKGCSTWGFMASFCRGVGETFYGLVSNCPHMAEYGGWIFDSDCRGEGGPGAPGCDYGAQFDNWIADQGGYDINSDAYQVPSALAAIFGVREGGLPKPGPRRVPMGFGNAAEFDRFGGQVNAGLRDAGIEGVTAVFQGSSVTGKSFRTGKPFGPHSDFDVALAGSGLLARAKEAGIPLRSGGTRTGPLKGADLERMGLGGLRSSLTQTANREVNFMIYGSVKDATTRAPSIIVQP